MTAARPFADGAGRRAMPLAWIVGATLASGAPAQNLLANPDLDAGREGWSAGLFLFHDESDADGCTGSGSAEVFDDGNGLVLGQCVAWAGGPEIVVESRYQLTGGSYYYYLRLFSEPGCAVESDLGVELYSEFFPASETWSAASETFDLSKQPSIASISVVFAVFENPAKAILRGDRYYAGSASPVFLDDLGAGDDCRWSESVGFEP